MRPNLITRLKEEWNNLDPVDPLRGLIADAIDALAEQPAQQEPVEWLTGCPECGMDGGCDCDSGTWNPPASKPWVGLTEEERKEIYRQAVYVDGAIRMTEAKLKEKNT